jgi:hypothetical protein
MAVYNGTAKRVKNALVILLQGITYDTGSGSEAAFTQVLDNTHNEFHADQTAQVLPGDVTDDQPTVAQADRVLSYIIRIRLALEDTPETESNTYDRMYDLTDLVLDTCDLSDRTGSLRDAIGAIGITLMQASRGDWVVLETNAGATLICDINIGITYSKKLY